MTNRMCVVTILICAGVAGCDETLGDCYPVGQSAGNGSGDPGAGATTGAGPDGLTMAQCNTANQSGPDKTTPTAAPSPPTPPPQIMPLDPCNQQCQDDYENAAAVCAKIADAAQRMACQNNAYANYKACRGKCAASPYSKECDDKYQDCMAKAPSSCLKKSGGKTLCQRCWERCNAGDSPSPACQDCLF